MARPSVVADASALICLGWVGQLQILPALVIAHLGAGETEVLSLGLDFDGSWLILDDAQARALARELGLRMLGTAAVLVEAKRAGLLARVRPTLDALMAKGFRLDRKVYDRILKAADEELLGCIHKLLA